MSHNFRKAAIRERRGFPSSLWKILYNFIEGIHFQQILKHCQPPALLKTNLLISIFQVFTYMLKRDKEMVASSVICNNILEKYMELFIITKDFFHFSFKLLRCYYHKLFCFKESFIYLIYNFDSYELYIFFIFDFSYVFVFIFYKFLIMKIHYLIRNWCENYLKFMSQYIQ